MKMKALFLFALAVQSVLPCVAQIDPQTKQLSRDILQQLIEINTTDSVGNVTTAAEAMAQRFRDAGFADSDIFIGGHSNLKIDHSYISVIGDEA